MDTYKLLISGIFDMETIEHREFFKVLLLNHSNKVLGVYTVSEGGISDTSVDIRLLMQAAILANATKIILAHNHPSGHLRASMEDDTATRKIQSACCVMGITLLDHLIVTSESYYSYADESRI
jgi:DNA repair protein RadC